LESQGVETTRSTEHAGGCWGGVVWSGVWVPAHRYDRGGGELAVRHLSNLILSISTVEISQESGLCWASIVEGLKEGGIESSEKGIKRSEKRNGYGLTGRVVTSRDPCGTAQDQYYLASLPMEGRPKMHRKN